MTAFKKIKISGQKLCYAVLGQGFPAVLTFGLAARGRVVVNELHKKLARSFRVLVIQFPDTRKSDQVLEAACKVLDAENIPKAVWWGSSIAGAISLLAGIKAPDRVAGLIVANSALPLPAAAPLATIMFGVLKIIPEKTLVRKTLEKAEKQNRDGPSEQFSSALSKKDLLNWVSLAGAYHRLGTKPFRVLKRKFPLLIIETEDDPQVPGSARRRMKEFFPGATVKTFPDGGHFPQISHQNEYAVTIRKFLEGF